MIALFHNDKRAWGRGLRLPSIVLRTISMYIKRNVLPSDSVKIFKTTALDSTSPSIFIMYISNSILAVSIFFAAMAFAAPGQGVLEKRSYQDANGCWCNRFGECACFINGVCTIASKWLLYLALSDGVITNEECLVE
jgi:hypothetical protein